MSSDKCRELFEKSDIVKTCSSEKLAGEAFSFSSYINKKMESLKFKISELIQDQTTENKKEQKRNCLIH